MSTIINDCIGANLALLDVRLTEAATTARAALFALRLGNRNQAIGTLLPLERELKVATALLETILELHRMPADPAGGAR